MIFITGATGLLGSHLTLELLKQGKSVCALKRKTSKPEELKEIFSWYVNNPIELYDKIEWINGDLEDYELILEIMAKVDIVYHCAAQVSFNPKDKGLMIENNVNGTASIVNAALEKGVSKLCHVSSVAAFGSSDLTTNVDETTVRQPGRAYSGYSISKYESEFEVWRSINEGLNAVIVNPSIIIGPGNWEKGSQRMFSEVYKGLKYYTKGITGYVDVRDVVKSMITLMDSDVVNERFCITSDNLSYKQVFTSIAKSLNKKEPSTEIKHRLLNLAWHFEKFRSFITGSEPIITKDSAKSAVNTTYYSNKKIINQIGINFIPIEESIKHTAKIFLKAKE